MRTISENILAALSAETVRVVYLVRLDFDSGVIGWNSSFRDITYNSLTYLGLGPLSSISTNQEEAGFKSSSATVGVSGIDPTIVSLLLSEPYMNRPAYIHYTLLDADDKVITGNPVMLFAGRMDGLSGSTGATANFSITLRSRFADWERVRQCLYTDAEQQKRYPGDKGMEFAEQMEKRRIIWPKAAFLPDPRPSANR